MAIQKSFSNSEFHSPESYLFLIDSEFHSPYFGIPLPSDSEFHSLLLIRVRKAEEKENQFGIPLPFNSYPHYLFRNSTPFALKSADI